MSEKLRITVSIHIRLLWYDAPQLGTEVPMFWGTCYLQWHTGRTLVGNRGERIRFGGPHVADLFMVKHYHTQQEGIWAGGRGRGGIHVISTFLPVTVHYFIPNDKTVFSGATQFHCFTHNPNPSPSPHFSVSHIQSLLTHIEDPDNRFLHKNVNCLSNHMASHPRKLWSQNTLLWEHKIPCTLCTVYDFPHHNFLQVEQQDKALVFITFIQISFRMANTITHKATNFESWSQSLSLHSSNTNHIIHLIQI
jgi:hypothetical protein